MSKPYTVQFQVTDVKQALGTLEVLNARLGAASSYYDLDGNTLGRVMAVIEGMWNEAAAQLPPDEPAEPS